MAHHNHVSVVTDHADTILERLALGRRGKLTGIFCGNDLSAQTEHGRLEGKTGASARFVKKCGHNFPLERGFVVHLQVIGQVEDLFDKFRCELLGLDDVIHPVRSRE